MTCEPWITENDLAVCDCPTNADPTAVAYAIAQATAVMYRLSGRRWPGICQATVIPCHCDDRIFDPFPIGLPASPSYPYREGGVWRNTGCGCRGPGVGCAGFQQTTLGTHMLVDVSEVVIDGVTLDPSAYRVDEGRWLVRTDGGVWPCCSRNWQVTFRYGRRPPADARRPTAEYAAELVKACTAGTSCSLPKRVQTITRDNVSMTIIDPFEFLENGRLGLAGPDQWLASVNPSRLQRRSRVWVPGMGRKVRRIG